MPPPSGARPRLLIVVNVFAPDRGGGAAVFSDLAYGLVERGFDVTVRCAYPYYPEWSDKSGRNGLAIERYMDRGVRVERYGLFIPRDPNALVQRLLYEASFFLSLARALRYDRGQFDVTMVFSPLIGAVGYAALRKRLFGGPLWLNVQDLSAEAAAAGGITKGRTVGRLFSGVQNALFNEADVWSTISPEMVARLAPARRGGQPLLYLPNWLNESVAETIRALPDKVGRAPAGPLRLLYAGNIGTKQDLLRYCRSLAASDAPFTFRIHGSGGRANDLRRWVEATGDVRFSFGPFLDESAFVRAIHDADLFVITETAGSGGSFIPSKLIPAIATGTPILAVSDASSPLGQEVLRAGLGPHLEWDELGELPLLLRSLSDDPAPLSAWQQQALMRSAFYRRDRVLGEVQEAFSSALAGRPLPDHAATLLL